MDKKRVFFVVVLLAFIFSVIFFFFGQYGSHTSTKRKESSLKVENRIKTVSSDKGSVSTSEIDSNTKNVAEDREKEIVNILMAFGGKWVNYQSIYERNQSVKGYLTENAIKEYGIDQNPHADFEGRGKINLITRDVTNDSRYVLLGEETARDSWNKIVITVEVSDEENPKISKIVVDYVRQAD